MSYSNGRPRKKREDNIKRGFRKQFMKVEVELIGSGSCPLASVGVSNVEHSDSAIINFEVNSA
jgi:hypothetical protein